MPHRFVPWRASRRLESIATRGRAQCCTRLRIWGSGVRISSGAPALSTVCALAFCRPFCKICFQDVLELPDSALGKLAGPREVLVENFLSTAQCVTGDCDDLTNATTSAEQHR